MLTNCAVAGILLHMCKRFTMLQIESFGPVSALHQGRALLGVFKPFMTVRCYCVDGLLVDSGLGAFAGRTLEWARANRANRVVLTHHHEDHSGGTPGLQQGGLQVVASEATRERLARGFVVYFYQRMVWGKAPRARVDRLGQVVETQKHRFQVLAAPGHCDDQVVLYEPHQGWLFSGDAFIGEKIRLFRGDEDFQATLDSLQRLCKLDFDSLFCAHRPRLGDGKAALQGKLQHLMDLQGRVLDLHARGHSIGAITLQLLGKERWLLHLFSLGDISKRNLVRAIVSGPRPRKEKSTP
jgi:glyoxylase-like metal-dependent hydrolase (beta-lactamase superfamily II)